MVVAMIAMRMMQMTVDQVVDVVAMRDGLMPAPRSMVVSWGVSGACVLGRANVRIGGRYRDHVFVNMIRMRMVEMAVVQIVDMAIVAHCGVPALGAVLMIVMGVVRLRAGCHRYLLVKVDESCIR